MTEAEWRSSDDWRAMLAFIKDKASPRKIRLLGVACCRRIAHLFHDNTCSRAVDAAERYADGLAMEAQRNLWANKVAALTEEADESERQLVSPPAYESALAVRAAIEEGDCLRSGGAILRLAAQAVWHEVYYRMDGPSRKDQAPVWASDDAKHAEVVAQLALIREVFGNPFTPVALEPAWRTETAVGLATGIYDDKAFERMPILADALEEAGCDNADILTHCREPGTHVRGCWVVDLVLGKA